MRNLLSRLTIPNAEYRLRPRSPWLGIYSPSSDFVDAAGSTWRSAFATSSTSVNTLGSWSEIISATTEDIHGLEITRIDNAANNNNASELIEIGKGSAGAEQTLFTLSIGYAVRGDNSWEIPIFIPAGTRLAMRTQCAAFVSNVAALYIRGKLYKNGPVPTSYVQTYGIDTSNSCGVLLNNSGVANTYGTWDEIVASTDEALSGLVVCPSGGRDTSHQNGVHCLDIGIGTAGSEQVIINSIIFMGDTNERLYFGDCNRLYGIHIPRGSRISARWSPGQVATNIDVALIGIPRSG